MCTKGTHTKFAFKIAYNISLTPNHSKETKQLYW